MLRIKKFCSAVLAATLTLFAGMAAEAVSPELARVKQIGFKDIQLPDNISNDEVAVKSIWFATKLEARKLKDVAIDYGSKNPDKDDCVVVIRIGEYKLDRSWKEPYAYGSDKIIETRKYKWKDNKGKEQEASIEHHREEPVGHPGGYYFTAKVAAFYGLYSPKTNQFLVEHTARGIDDKEIDEFRKQLKEFYKKVNKEIKESKKTYGK